MANNDVGFTDESPNDAADEQGADEAPSNDLLPTIFLDRDFHVVLDDAMRALASDPLLFSKGDQLVRVIVDGDSPRLLALGGAQLREVLSSRARWIKEDPVHPPSSVATALAKRGQWRYLRELRALTLFPVLSPPAICPGDRPSAKRRARLRPLPSAARADCIRSETVA